MGLDIKIFACEDKDSEDFIVFSDISRAFCTLIRVQEKEDQNELIQLSKITHVDISVLRKMSTWSIWERQYGGFTSTAEEAKFIREYTAACDNSWQDTDRVLNCLTGLHSALMNDLSFASRIDYKLEWLLTFGYFQDFDKDVSFNDRLMHKNFGWDLRNMIDFLNTAKKKNKKYVRFQID